MAVKFSLITCARHKLDSQPLYSSIPSRLHPSFEFIEIVSPQSMGAGYNEAMQRATGDVLIFTHTDVSFWEQEWLDYRLQKMSNLLVDIPTTGFAGVAGGALDDRGVWWANGTRRGKINQPHGTVIYGSPGPVQVLDGCFLAVSRSTLQKRLSLWDPLMGWHFYDIDMTYRATRLGLVNYVIDLPLWHESTGSTGPEWEKSRQRFLNCYRGQFTK